MYFHLKINWLDKNVNEIINLHCIRGNLGASINVFLSVEIAKAFYH
jgi:hypothetical protein